MVLGCQMPGAGCASPGTVAPGTEAPGTRHQAPPYNLVALLASTLPRQRIAAAARSTFLSRSVHRSNTLVRALEQKPTALSVSRSISRRRHAADGRNTWPHAYSRRSRARGVVLAQRCGTRLHQG